ncbi:hypothetical protein JF66_17345 [Cryobacterium sp. MLB-32]|nr:hypothetical protein JF66_17345 [Cryobacterium sp. MLB-32]
MNLADRPLRVHSVFEFQIVVFVAMLISPIAVVAVRPPALNPASYLAGLLLVVVASIVALLWWRSAWLARFAVLIPLADLAGIRVMATSAGANPLGDGFLLILPMVWLAYAFGLRAAAGGLALGIVLDSLLRPSWDYGDLSSVSALEFVRLVSLPLLLVILTTSSWLLGRRIRLQQTQIAAQTALTTAALEQAERSNTLVSEVINAVDFAVIAFDRAGAVTLTNRFVDGVLRPGIPDFYHTDGSTPFAAGTSPVDRSRRGESFNGILGWVGAAQDGPLAFSATSRSLAGSRDGTAGTDSTDSPDGTVLVLRNITTELLAVRARDDLVAMVTHDLRTPLTAIIGNAERLLGGTDAPATVARRIEVILRNGQRMDTMLSDLLQARSTADALVPLVPDNVDLRGVVLESIHSLTPAAAARGIRMCCEPTTAIPVFADPTRLRQVLDNLLSNAIKYNGNAGTITVRAFADADTVTVLVHDTGDGVSPADSSHVFDLHYRTESARRSEEQGLGLGLSISRDIARRHGGDLTLDPAAPTTGSTFRLTLPHART